MNRIANLEDILEVAGGFWKSKVLLCAVGLDLFSRLDGKPATVDEVATQVLLDDHAASDFLALLADLGLLEQHRLDGEMAYASSEIAARHLSTRGSAYVGALLQVWNSRSYRMWTHLDTALRVGEHSTNAGDQCSNGIPIRNLEHFTGTFDLSAYRTICHLGNTEEMHQIAVASRSARIAWMSFDARMEEDPTLPSADAYTTGGVLRHLDVTQRRRFIRRVHDALPAHGALVVIDKLFDDERPANAVALLGSLHTLLELSAPSEFGFAEFTAWCREAGFQGFERLPLGNSHLAAIAFKSSSAGTPSVSSRASAAGDGQEIAPTDRTERKISNLRGRQWAPRGERWD
jgi:hypothetical protein